MRSWEAADSCEKFIAKHMNFDLPFTTNQVISKGQVFAILLFPALGYKS